ncbi:rod shape-determining protein MreD [Halothermothrix orenii]|uniref:Uncharacterized protein n=1 Tax=Halothermothrix orenii (strain H 168 / OCM 544 / DSM 9562) TaxID=373903 RepID=B8CY02_HALOH|nr:rod shape-determining protein MreD [Halothermothrix orenii]ACL70171.1 hypothetical protein Hore_14220 [Halothermothrix orenii H 168]
MKKIVWYVLLFTLIIIIQLTIPPRTLHFDLFLVTIIVMGLIKGSKAGAWTGFIGGNIQDLFLGGMFGTYTIVKLIMGGLSGLLEKEFFKENPVVPVATIFIASIFHGLLVILITEELLFNINLFTALRQTILPEAFFNSIAGIIIYYIVYRLERGGELYYG